MVQIGGRTVVLDPVSGVPVDVETGEEFGTETGGTGFQPPTPGGLGDEIQRDKPTPTAPPGEEIKTGPFQGFTPEEAGIQPTTPREEQPKIIRKGPLQGFTPEEAGIQRPGQPGSFVGGFEQKFMVESEADIKKVESLQEQRLRQELVRRSEQQALLEQRGFRKQEDDTFIKEEKPVFGGGGAEGPRDTPFVATAKGVARGEAGEGPKLAIETGGLAGQSLLAGGGLRTIVEGGKAILIRDVARGATTPIRAKTIVTSGKIIGVGAGSAFVGGGIGTTAAVTKIEGPTAGLIEGTKFSAELLGFAKGFKGIEAKTPKTDITTTKTPLKEKEFVFDFTKKPKPEPTEKIVKAEVTIIDAKPGTKTPGPKVKLIDTKPPARRGGRVTVIDTKPPARRGGKVTVIDTKPPARRGGKVTVIDTKPPTRRGGGLITRGRLKPAIIKTTTDILKRTPTEITTRTPTRGLIEPKKPGSLTRITQKLPSRPKIITRPPPTKPGKPGIKVPVVPILPIALPSFGGGGRTGLGRTFTRGRQPRTAKKILRLKDILGGN